MTKLKAISACLLLVLVSLPLMPWAASAQGGKKGPIPKAENVLPGWDMKWVKPGPAVVIIAQDGQEPIAVCVGAVIATKQGFDDIHTIVGGTIVDGNIPTAREAASDTSLSGKVKITSVDGYEKWRKERAKTR